MAIRYYLLPGLEPLTLNSLILKLESIKYAILYPQAGTVDIN